MRSDDMNKEAPHRLVFREEVRNAIREAIFSGELKPGDRIIETFWAKELNVSQGPVREAIRDLEGQGLVETVPFKGSRVRVMTEKDIRDNYGVRICLETKSIRDAISLLDDAQMETLAEKLSQILAEMDECAERGDLRRFTDCDAQFHKEIILSTGNLVLLRLWEQCNMRIWFMITGLTGKEVLHSLQKSHHRLLKDICSRHIEGATATIDQHITALMDGYISGKMD